MIIETSFTGGGQTARAQCGHSGGIRHRVDDNSRTDKSRVFPKVQAADRVKSRAGHCRCGGRAKTAI